MALRHFLDKQIDRHNFKLNLQSPGAGFFYMETHILLTCIVWEPEPIKKI